MRILIIAAAITLAASCNSNGVDVQTKRDTVYLSKPALTDSTILKAHLPVKVWGQMFEVLVRQANKIGVPKDSAEVRVSRDSVAMAINTISFAIRDTTLNKPYF